MAATSKDAKAAVASMASDAAKPAAPRGSWIVLGPDGLPRMVEASKMRALEAAVEVKGSIELWEFGVWQNPAVKS